MKIIEIQTDKRLYMELLLLADEQIDMIEKYLERGTMFVLDDNGVKAECVVTDEGNNVIEMYWDPVTVRAANISCISK